MFLAIGNIVGPVASMDSIVVEQWKWTLLNGRGSVPAVPVSSARCGVREDTILPLTVLSRDWLFCGRAKIQVYKTILAFLKFVQLTAHHFTSVWATHSMWVVAVIGQSLLESSKSQTIGTSLDDGLAIDAFVKVIAILFVSEQVSLSVFSTQLLRIGTSTSLCRHLKEWNMKQSIRPLGPAYLIALQPEQSQPNRWLWKTSWLKLHDKKESNYKIRICSHDQGTHWTVQFATKWKWIYIKDSWPFPLAASLRSIFVLFGSFDIIVFFVCPPLAAVVVVGKHDKITAMIMAVDKQVWFGQTRSRRALVQTNHQARCPRPNRSQIIHHARWSSSTESTQSVPFSCPQ